MKNSFPCHIVHDNNELFGALPLYQIMTKISIFIITVEGKALKITMKKVLMLTLTLCMAIVANAQELPYSKYLNFDKRDFKENKFKYDGETNTWAIRKVNGWHTTFNILAIIAAPRHALSTQKL